MNVKLSEHKIDPAFVVAACAIVAMSPVVQAAKRQDPFSRELHDHREVIVPAKAPQVAAETNKLRVYSGFGDLVSRNNEVPELYYENFEN